MTTPINTFQDILEALAQNPELLEQLRWHVLPREVLELPEKLNHLAAVVANFVEATQAQLEAYQKRFENLEAGQARLEADVGQLKSDVTDLKAGQARMETRVDRIDVRLNRIEGRLGNIDGSEYEQRIPMAAINRCIQQLQIRNPIAAYTQFNGQPFFLQMLQEAEREGKITSEEYDELTDADVIMTGSNERHTVIEASLSASQHDLTRAIERAAILAKITGHQVFPVVATPRPHPQLRSHAETQGVAVFDIRPRQFDSEGVKIHEE